MRPVSHPPFNPYVRFPAYGLPMIFLAWLRCLRIADGATEPVQAVPVKPLLGPRLGLPGSQVPAPLLDHQAAEAEHHVVIGLAELISGVPSAEVVAPAARDTAKSWIKAVTCGAVMAVDAPGVSAGGGQGPGGTVEVTTLTIFCREGHPPADDIFAYPGSTAPDGRIFRTVRGGLIQDSAYSAVWADARAAALTPAQQASPLARRPYDLRYAGASLALNAGVPATEVARRAGHSVVVLLKIYAHCIDGQADAANKRIADALGGTEDSPDDQSQDDQAS